MAAEDIGSVYKTKIPGYDDAADIQAALKLYHYGTTTVPTTEAGIVADSIAGHLKALDTRLDSQENVGPGSKYTATEPVTATGLVNGYIWVDQNSSAPSIVSFATAIYQNEEPTTGLTDGVIWVDKDTTPHQAYIYSAATSQFVPMNEFRAVDASGDLIYGTGDNQVTRLGIGSNGQVLKVVSGLPAWTAYKSWALKTSGSLSGSSVSITGLSTCDKFYIVLKDWSHNDSTNAAVLSVRFNSDSGPNYVNTGGVTSANALYSATTTNTSTYDMTIFVDLSNSASALKPVSTNFTNGSQNYGYYKNTNAITSVQISLSPSGSFDAGTYEIWGYE